MEKFYEEKITYNQITFRFTKGKSHMTGNEIHPYHEILYYIDGDENNGKVLNGLGLLDLVSNITQFQ